MKKLNKKHATKPVGKEQVVESKNDLKQRILQLTEQKVEDKFSDKQLDRQNEIIKLRNGSTINVKSLADLIEREAKAYAVTFPQEWYKEIYRLKGWQIPPSGIIGKKPWAVSVYTIELIYGRFYREVLPELRKLNPYIGHALRGYKHFQFLSDNAKLSLENFIMESTAVMKTCTSWHEFRVKYGNKYGVPFQYSLLDQNQFNN